MPIVSVTDLHHVALAVPDLASERQFFGGTWGLQEVAEQEGKGLLRRSGLVERLRDPPAPGYREED